MTNGQRPANPNRISIFKAKPFPDGRQPASEFSVNIFLTIDMLLELMDALQNGVVQPEDGYHGVQGVTLWGNGYRGTGEKAPIITGTINTHKAIWQARQRQQQADPIYQGQPVQAPQQQQVAPAYAAAFPPQQQQAPQQAPATAPAPAPVAQPAPIPGGGWGAPPQPSGGNQWATTPPAL